MCGQNHDVDIVQAVCLKKELNPKQIATKTKNTRQCCLACK